MDENCENASKVDDGMAWLVGRRVRVRVSHAELGERALETFAGIYDSTLLVGRESFFVFVTPRGKRLVRAAVVIEIRELSELHLGAHLPEGALREGSELLGLLTPAERIERIERRVLGVIRAGSLRSANDVVNAAKGGRGGVLRVVKRLMNIGQIVRVEGLLQVCDRGVSDDDVEATPPAPRPPVLTGPTLRQRIVKTVGERGDLRTQGAILRVLEAEHSHGHRIIARLLDEGVLEVRGGVFCLAAASGQEVPLHH